MIELVAIGDEVLNGYTINRNAAHIAKVLVEKGFTIFRHSVVSDDAASVKELLQEALKRNSCVITTGGLGPTCDDQTKKIVSELFHLKLVEPEGLRQKLLLHFGEILDEQLLQPEGAYLFENKMGSASGFALDDPKRFAGACLICLPGVPLEMQAMLEDVTSYLQERYSVQKHDVTQVLHFHSVTECEVDDVLRQIQKQMPRVQVGIYPGFSVMTVHLKCRAESSSVADTIIAPAKEYLLSHFGKNYFTSPSGSLMEVLHNELIEKKITLATAESCTGGGLAKAFVVHPNASGYFQGSIVCYTNESKIKLLQVPKNLLQEFGAVSCQVTDVMAENVQKQFSSTCAIAVSGILGPTGATPTKPIGTVCATICLKDRLLESWTMHLFGSREAILEQAIQHIAARLYRMIVGQKI